MPLSTVPLPFGMRDIKLTPYVTDSTLGTSVDLPYSRTLEFGEAEEFEELRGDDKTIAFRGRGPVVEWSLEAGGISFEAFQVLNGGTIVESGTAPAQSKTYSKLANDSKPYFKAEGQAISDSGGDFHVVLYKCKVTGNVEGSLEDGQFWVTSAEGTAVSDSTDKLYDFVQNETAVPIT